MIWLYILPKYSPITPKRKAFTPKENRAPLREHYDDVEKQNEAEWKKKEYKEAAESGGGFNSCSKGMDINIYTT